LLRRSMLDAGEHGHECERSMAFLGQSPSLVDGPSSGRWLHGLWRPKGRTTSVLEVEPKSHGSRRSRALTHGRQQEWARASIPSRGGTIGVRFPSTARIESRNCVGTRERRPQPSNSCSRGSRGEHEGRLGLGHHHLASDGRGRCAGEPHEATETRETSRVRISGRRLTPPRSS